MFYWFLKYTLGPVLKVIWVERVEGANNIPKTGAVVIAANHSSYFDLTRSISLKSY